MTPERLTVAGTRMAWWECGPLMLSIGHSPHGWTVTAWLWRWSWRWA